MLSVRPVWGAVWLPGAVLATALISGGCTVGRSPAGLSPAFLAVQSVTRLSDLRAVSPPAWAPDGRWLAVSTRDALWLLRADGSDARRLAPVPRVTEVAWAPDGRSLAALADGSLYMVSPEGTSPRRLTGSGHRVRRFAWAPRENQVAYVASAGGRDAIWLVRGDGVETATDVSVGSAPPREAVRMLSWYPDGRALLVGLGAPGDPGVDGFFQILVSRPRFTRLALHLPEAAVAVVPSPSVRFLAFLGGTEADVRAGQRQVVVVRADGAGRRTLTSPGMYSGLAWARSGSLLAFAVSADGELSLIVADAVTGERLKVADYRPETSEPVGGAAVAWAPDGLRIAFGTDTGETEGPVWIATLQHQ